ncbi:ABC transporter ATP-binding protein/permease [Niallia taxi]|uniref:ABC transporter ATP-binding protein n=1 Tax=Niallia taxi TaxID=2499688 RepID=UPI002934ED6C|nr:ABC transporter ATP-binding protein [Niallia taxi]WOD63849.1 ABC transporter ATP-binding protein/permease [Niallia taxi]
MSGQHQSKNSPIPSRGHGGPSHMPVQKAKDAKGTLKRLAKYLGAYKLQLLFVIIAAILSTVFSIFSPKILAKAIDNIFNGLMAKMNGVPGAVIDFGAIGQILLWLIVLYIVSSLFMYIQQIIMVNISQKTIFQLRQEVHEKLERLPLKYFDRTPHGETLSRAINDIDNINNTMQQSVTQLITSVITFVGVIIMMLTISPVLALVCFLTIPLSIFATVKIAKRSQVQFRSQQATLGALNGHIEEMFTGHQIVKAFGHEKKAIEKFDGINDKLFESSWKSQFISGLIMPLMQFINNIGYVFVVVIGAIYASAGRITVGDVQAFIQYARQFSQPIQQLSNISNVIQSTIASAERVFDLLDEEEEAENSDEKHVIDHPSGAVQFDSVYFSYKEDEELIKDLNIQINPGQKVAIVGPTGAGKTTLINLLMRFYDLNRGSIKIDDVDISTMERGRLRSMFGMVLQDTWLFKGTIRENIAYGKQGATDEEVSKAAALANAEHFIRTLPDGYETVINEDGSNISQGQKQLLTIARALLADPALLILDEATSSVDTRTEAQIQEAMAELMKNRTSFVIAHRLSTIKDADVILVMKNGQVIEQGNHEELLQQNGFYADLYNSQFSEATA